MDFEDYGELTYGEIRNGKYKIKLKRKENEL